MMTLKSPPIYMFSKSHKYDNYDQVPYKVFPYYLFPQGKPVRQAIYCPTANFGPLSRGRITNLMLITEFDTYSTPSHQEPRNKVGSHNWPPSEVWIEILPVLNVAH